jgi:hypothetical protein
MYCRFTYVSKFSCGLQLSFRLLLLAQNKRTPNRSVKLLPLMIFATGYLQMSTL